MKLRTQSARLNVFKSQIESFWMRESAEWDVLKKAVYSLRQSKIRSFNFDDGVTVKAQCIESRLKNAGVQLDSESLSETKCLLCPENLQKGQRGIRYRDRWLVLCNRSPIFEPHFLINCMEHEPQRIRPAIKIMLEAIDDFEGAYSLFYNGPLAGASIPQHIHIQVAPANILPFEKFLRNELCGLKKYRNSRQLNDQKENRNQIQTQQHKHRIEWLRMEPVAVGLADFTRNSAVVIAGKSKEFVEAGLLQAVARLNELLPEKPEPKLNLFISRYEGFLTSWLFPRRFHRPSCFGFGQEDYIIRPGTVDLAGLLMVPRPADLKRLTTAVVKQIYREVTLTSEQNEGLRQSLIC